MKRKALSMVLAASMIAGSLSVPAFAEEAAASDFSAEEFATPGQEWHPGVRWWWPGGAVDQETLTKEIDYLAANGFAYVEINPFAVETILAGDEEKVASVYTPEFYELLDFAVGYCEEKGITVDLNMGSGWNANSQDVTYEESMGNMALGRVTVKGADAKASLEIPAAEISSFYTGEGAKGEWNADAAQLQGVLVAKTAGAGFDFVQGEGWAGPTPSYEEVYDTEGNVVKSYDTQILLDKDNSFFVKADDAQIADGKLTLSEENAALLEDDAEYEVVAMYFIPSGGKGIDSAMDWYVVDHMDAEYVTDYMNDWLGSEGLAPVLQNHSNIRALFNDSYEFYSDIYYTRSMEDLAADAENNGIGYDFTKYLPTIYKQYAAAPYYMGLGTKDTYLTYASDESEKARITYDYNVLVGEKFAEGLEAFQAAANASGLKYRQEAYNPPIDTIGSAQYVDIPETEQASEFDLKRVSSGAHLYNKNLVTCEQYTLGRTPLANSLEQVKIGYDIMATSGVTNFFYHGFMYGYGVDSEEYGEMGWAPFPGIGINMSERNTLAPYFGEMNEYAARVNYLMQLGAPSMDVAYYMPYNGSLAMTDAVAAMNSEGIAWDAINDASIVSEDTTFADGQISVNGGNMVYDAIVVDAAAVPVATMEKLQALAEAGASIIFYGAAPAQQPGFADGNYAEEDAKTAAAAEAAIASGAVLAADADAFKAALAEKVTPVVSYASNDAVRFARRTLSDGSEVVYVRNIGTEANTITLEAGEGFGNAYYLDQSTGKIYAADKQEDGTVTFTMDASVDMLTGMFGGGDSSMAIAILFEAGDAALDASAVTEGVPAALDQTPAADTKEVSFTSLTVGGKTYEENVTGLWNSPDFQNGELMNSADDGVYTGTFTLDALNGQKAVLTFSELYGASTVTVNGTEVGTVLYAPYEIDITDAAVEGENTVEIKVTPRKYNKIHLEAAPEELVNNGLAGGAAVEIR